MDMRSKERVADYYSDSMQHLLAELEWLDLTIQAEVARARSLHAADGEFQGLYIAEEEVDALLATPAGMPRWTHTPLPAPAVQLLETAERLHSEVERRKRESVRRGIPLRLEALAQLFQLGPFDIDVILICLAPELDLRYERLYAYLQDDITKTRPSVDLVLNLLCQTFEEKLSARQRCADTASLLRHRLLSLFCDPSRQEPTLLGKFLKLEERIADYLLGSDALDKRIRPFTRLINPEAQLDELFLPDDLKGRLALLVDRIEADDVAQLFYFQGPYGVGKQTTAEALCARIGAPLLLADGQRLALLPEEEFETLLHLIAREAVLQGAALYWKGFDALLVDERKPRLESLLKHLEGWNGLGFLAGEMTWEPADRWRTTAFNRVEFVTPGYRDRLRIWNQALKGIPLSDEVEPEDLAGRFRLAGGRIQDATATAGNLARWRDPDAVRINRADLNAACRLQSNRKLSQLAQQLRPRYRWSDIVLPERRLRQLREVYNAAKYRSLVYNEWGFGEKLSLGKGLNVLFTGGSGTGKTMAAEILAGELSLDMYKIDLSTVVSKYIGETEKNLSRIFTEAETSNAILFFDEADALFGKRSEVQDAHDRYANIEIGYLLQRMEEYEGVVILATNLGRNMDEAFVRRMHFTIEFPFPKEKDRHRIWQGVWPASTPLSNELDLNFMAGRFELAGGNIKNVALAAAFMAADDGSRITMRHLIQATQREYEKMGKVLMEGEFGEYGRLVAG